MLRLGPVFCSAVRSLLCVLLVVGAATLVAGQGRAHQVSVDDPRPLAAALDELEQRHGWVLTYEDPAWLGPGDRVDVRANVRRSGVAAPVWVPRGGSLVLSYEVDPATASTGRGSALTALLDEYDRGGYPGAFRIVEGGNVTHIVPRQAADATGALRTWTPILDARIFLPALEESVLDRIRRLAAEVSKRTGWPIELGTIPVNLLASARAGAVMAPAPESARTALSRALASTGHSLSWRLYFAPGPAGRFFLNIHPVAGAQRPAQPKPTKARG